MLRVVNVILSGEVYHALGPPRHVVALAMDPDMRWMDPEPVRSHLRGLLQAEGPRSRPTTSITHAPVPNDSKVIAR